MEENNTEQVIAATKPIEPQVTSVLDWKEWIEVYGSRLHLFARQQTRNEQDAEDALQDALVKLAKKVAEGVFVGGQEAWMPFLYTQIRREAIDRGRKDNRRRKREETLVADAQGLRPVDESNWFQSGDGDPEKVRLLENAIRDLPQKFAEVVNLKIWGERTFDQIGEALGISMYTAASRYRYGLEALRKKLASARIRGDI